MNKTLKKQNFEYQESKDFLKRERSFANTEIILGKLKLTFLSWLEFSGPGNHKTTFETEAYDPQNLWDLSSWSEAIYKFSVFLKEEDFFVDIIGSHNNYKITIALWDENDPKMIEQKKETKKILKEHMDLHNKIPYEIQEKMDDFFKLVTQLKKKDSPYDNPKYKEFLKLVSKNYTKNEKFTSLVNKLIKSKEFNKLLSKK